MNNNPQSYEECQARISKLRDKIEDLEDEIRDLEWKRDSAEEDLAELEVMLTAFPPDPDSDELAALEAEEEAEREEARQRELLHMAYKGFPRIPDNIADYWQRVG